MAVPADITDGESAARLAEAALAAFGRVDTLVHNAFAIPPLTGLADADLAAIRAAFETNVLAALRLTRLLTPALAASRGSVVMINSAVLRHSRPGFGGYKMAKAALLALAQSLASELGPQGIRVNSVAPGYIWGDSLKWYFGYLARQRGVDAQQVYDETAATIDLRRLPEPDEVADAVVFLASPMARAITGQCLGRQRRRVPPLTGGMPVSARAAQIGTAEDLHASATKITGLADFGADDYRDGLAVLLESYARDAGLTELGSEGAPGLPARRAGGPAAQRGGVGALPRARRGRPSSGRSSSPGCPGPAPPRCTGCSRPTRRTRAWSCG